MANTPIVFERLTKDDSTKRILFHSPSSLFLSHNSVQYLLSPLPRTRYKTAYAELQSSVNLTHRVVTKYD